MRKEPDLAQISDQDIPEESESETIRESRCIPGGDPDDVNRGDKFIFLERRDANERMWRNKRRVRYVFEGEEEQNIEEEKKIVEAPAQPSIHCSQPQTHPLQFS